MGHQYWAANKIKISTGGSLSLGCLHIRLFRDLLHLSIFPYRNHGDEINLDFGNRSIKCGKLKDSRGPNVLKRYHPSNTK